MRVKISSRDITFDIEITGKYTIVVGESGTGKTRLAAVCGLVSMGAASVEPSTVKVYGVSENSVFPAEALAKETGALFVVDESHLKHMRDSGMSSILNSNNYFVILTRDGSGHVPYGLDNVVKLVGSSKHKRPVPYDGVFYL